MRPTRLSAFESPTDLPVEGGPELGFPNGREGLLLRRRGTGQIGRRVGHFQRPLVSLHGETHFTFQLGPVILPGFSRSPVARRFGLSVIAVFQVDADAVDGIAPGFLAGGEFAKRQSGRLVGLFDGLISGSARLRVIASYVPGLPSRPVGSAAIATGVCFMRSRTTIEASDPAMNRPRR